MGSYQDDRLAPWHLDELISVWDKYWAEPLKFRIFTHKKDARDSLRRYTRILQNNRHWLNAGRGVDLETLHSECRTQLLIVGSWLIAQTDQETPLEILGGPAARTMGFWAFARTDLRNLSVLYGMATGQGADIAQAQRWLHQADEMVSNQILDEAYSDGTSNPDAHELQSHAEEHLESQQREFALLELVPYSFRHRYSTTGHGRGLQPKQMADAMGHSLEVHMGNYARFMTRDLASAFDVANTQTHDRGARGPLVRG